MVNSQYEARLVCVVGGIVCLPEMVMGLCTDVDGVVLGLMLGILHHISEVQP